MENKEMTYQETVCNTDRCRNFIEVKAWYDQDAGIQHVAPGQPEFCDECLSKRRYEQWRDDMVARLTATAETHGWEVHESFSWPSTYLLCSRENQDGELVKIRISNHHQKYDADYSIEFTDSPSAIDEGKVLARLARY